ncbi:MAG: hypothetical protein ABSH48_14750 [Verrucomicrobiota bacterium]
MEQRRDEAAATFWKHLRRRLAVGTRLVFIFLFGATVLVFLYCHAPAIQQSAASKVKGAAWSISESSRLSPIRQIAITDEKEVDEVTR